VTAGRECGLRGTGGSHPLGYAGPEVFALLPAVFVLIKEMSV
jgi:hypothetical protein